MQNEDLDRLEFLCKEIHRTPASKRGDRAVWDLVERLATEVILLRFQMGSEQWNTERREEASSFGDEGMGHW